MQYLIHNEKSIETKEQRKRIKETIKKQVQRLNTIEGNYPKPLLVNIHINKSDRINYTVSCSIKMKEGIVFVAEKGDNIEAIVYTLFDKLQVALNKKINKERKYYIRKTRNKHARIFNEHLTELQNLKQTNTRETFNDLLKVLLSDIAKYVKRRISSAEMTTAIKRGKFKKQEILDEIYLHVYEHLDDLPGDEGFTRIWLYQITDRILREKLKEIEFEKENFLRLAEIVDAEYASMEENFTVDAEEEIIPLEELDEYENQSDLSMATILYEEDEDSILDELTLNINKNDIRGLLEQELTKLPVYERTIMEYYLINQMSIHEIAEIKKFPENEIEKVIHRVCADLKEGLAFFLLKK